jgi:hypothetical protein
MRNALEDLSSIGAGNIGVTLAAQVYTLTFQGTLANTNVGAVTCADSLLLEAPAAAVDLAETVAGVAGTNHQKKVTIYGDTGTTFTVAFDGSAPSGALDADISAGDFQTAFRALTGVGAGNANVTRAGAAGKREYTIEFVGAKASIDYTADLVTVVDTALRNTGTSTTTVGGVAGTNQKKAIVVDATSGSYTVTWNGATSTSLDVNATEQQFEDAFLALSSVGAGNANVVRSGVANGYTYTIEFLVALAGTDYDAVPLTRTLTNVLKEVPNAGIAETIKGVAGGTWTATFDAVETAAIAFDATGAAVEAELLSAWAAATPALDAGDLTVVRTGTLGAYVYTITWAEDWAFENVGAITTSDASLGDYYAAGTQSGTAAVVTTGGTSPLVADIAAAGYEAGELPWFDASGASGTAYWFAIRAVNADGKSDPSNQKHILYILDPYIALPGFRTRAIV